MEIVKIAILDSGFDFKTPLSCKIAECKSFCSHNCIDESGHGTSVIRIIDKICPDSELYIYKVLDSNKTGNFLSVKEAINCALSRHVDIINASFGIESELYKHEIHKICNQVFKQNTVIITTSANNSARNYLFEHEKVLKVIGGKGIYEDRLYYKDGIFFVKGMARMIPWLNGHYLLKGGNSFSLPYIIPYIIKAKQSGCMAFDDILDFLKNIADATKDTRIFYDYPIVKKKDIINSYVYEIVKKYMIEKNLLDEKDGISNYIFTPYKIEDILQDLEILFQCQFPCTEFQYPDWCYVENLSHKIYTLIKKMEMI